MQYPCIGDGSVIGLCCEMVLVHSTRLLSLSFPGSGPGTGYVKRPTNRATSICLTRLSPDSYAQGPGRSSINKLPRAMVAPFLLLALTLPVPRPTPCDVSGPKGNAAATAVNAFAIDLYGQIRKPQGNLIFSPYSISMALALAYTGARGRTESQMAQALHFNVEKAKLDEAFRDLNGQILSAGNGKAVEINVANALWAEKSYTFKKDYLEAVQTTYQGDLRKLDFFNGPQAATKTINSWVEERTNHKIRDLIPPGIVTKDTSLVLTNAIFFKGRWQSGFEERATKRRPFVLLDRKEIQVPMMSRLALFRYTEKSGLQVLEMPYKSGDLSMVILLPSIETRLENFELSITFDQLDRLLGSLTPSKVWVNLPRFTMTSTLTLRSALTELGMIDAFFPTKADFSGMTGNRDLYIEQGIHKAFVKVNERGTEAAAATSVI